MVYIFVNKKGISSSRLQSWSVILSEYIYKIEHIKRINNANADCLYRLPLAEESNASHGDNFEYTYLNFMSENAINDNEAISIETGEDELLSEVYHYVLNDWPKQTPDYYYKFSKQYS